MTREDHGEVLVSQENFLRLHSLRKVMKNGDGDLEKPKHQTQSMNGEQIILKKMIAGPKLLCPLAMEA